MRFLKRLLTFLGRTDGSLQHRAFRSGIWVGVSSVGVAGLTFARGIVLARLLTPEVFGLMAISFMATRLIEIFTATGFGAALIHRTQRFEDARDTAFTLMVARGFGLALLCVFIAPWIARFYEQPILTAVMAVSGITFIFNGLRNINMVALEKELDLKVLTYMELLKTSLAFAVTVWLAYSFRSVWALVYAQVATAAIGSALSFIMVPGRVRLGFDATIARELYQYGRFITGLAIVVFLTRELDHALIGKVLGVEMLGYYVVAYSLATLPVDFLSRFIGKVYFPMFSKLQNDFAGLRAEYARGIRLITVLMVPLCVAVAVLSPEIVQTLYGSRWSQTVAPLRVLAVFGCFRALWMLNGYLYNAIGRPYIDFYTNLARLIVMGALLLPLTRWYGLVGASVAVAAPMAAQFGLGLYLSRRFIGAPLAATVRPLASAAAQAAVLAVVLIAAKSVVAADPRIGLICLTAIGCAVALALNLRDIRTLLAAAGAR